jgi:hypothetical protein
MWTEARLNGGTRIVGRRESSVWDDPQHVTLVLGESDRPGGCGRCAIRGASVVAIAEVG